MSEHADMAATYLERAARAIADGDQLRAQRQFTAAWRHAIHVVKSIAWGRLGDSDLVDEAASRAGVKLWAQLRGGYQPRDGWAQILISCAKAASIDSLDQYKKRDPERNQLDESHTHPDRGHDTSVSKIETLARAYEASGRRSWGTVLRAVATRAVTDAAPIEWEEIATDIGRSPVDVRQIVFQMKADTDFRALFAPGAQPDAEIPEQTSLFDATPTAHTAA